MKLAFFDRMSMPVVLITGSSGLLGTALVARLAGDYTVVGLDRERAAQNAPTLEADLTNRESIDAALATLRESHGRTLAAVVHLAAFYDFSGEPHPLYQRLNVDGTALLLETLRHFDVGRFVYASTILVHAPGSAPGIAIDESSPIAPAWAYPQSKAAAETAIRDHRGDLPCAILRLAGIYSDTSAVPTLTQQIRRIYERRLQGNLYTGDKTHGQSMVHIDDAVEALALAVERRDALPDCTEILIGEPVPLSYEALQNQIAQALHGEPIATLSVPGAVAKAGAWIEQRMEPLVPDAIDRGEEPFVKPFMIALASDHYELDISRARDLLGWQPRHRLRDSLPSICANLKRDPLAWYRANKLVPPAWLESLDRAGGAEASRARHEAEYRAGHGRSRWAQFVNIGIGGWLLTAPAIHGYSQLVLGVSDAVAGALLIVLAALSLSWRFPAARWGQALLGTYVMTAPLLVWTPDAAAYLDGSLVGALIVGFAVALPPAPGIAPVAVLSGPTVPPGWSFTPSSWTQRLPIVALAFVGLYISRYLAAYQLGHIDSVWEPFFDARAVPEAGSQNGTEAIVTSAVSRAWPVPDAGLGALTYALEILTGLIGSARRWRTMPWLVLLFGLMIVPLGGISLFFIIIQPIVIGTWCTLCLVAAAAMLLQIPYSLDEIVATTQFLRRRRRAGQSLLRVFFRGDTDEAEAAAPKVPADEFDRSAGAVVADMLGGGIGLPWNLLASAAIGVGLMTTRLSLGTAAPLAHADHLIGALVVTVSVAALAEVARPARFFNALLGIALLGTPFMFDGGGAASTAASLVAGLALIALSLPRGAVRNSYGGWSRCLV